MNWKNLLPWFKTSMRKNTKLWTMKNGRKIRICDMSTPHIRNTIRMLERMAQHIRILDFVNFPMLNGEMAQYFAEQDFDRAISRSDGEIIEEELTPLYHDLVEEYKRRLEMEKDLVVR